jgi:hypothetical protein
MIKGSPCGYFLFPLPERHSRESGNPNLIVSFLDSPAKPKNDKLYQGLEKIKNRREGL